MANSAATIASRKTNMQLSLIVPVFNVAPYLRQFLDSLVALLPAPDEIIVVDDGSTDECPSILAEYSQCLPQMRILRQENQGVSVARNTGLACATGEFVAFVDPDDFLEPDMYAVPLNLMRADRLDVLMMNGIYHFEDREPDRLIYQKSVDTAVLEGQVWLKTHLQSQRYLHYVWLHVFRRSFLLEIGVQFVPGLIHEDVLWLTETLLSAKRVRSISQVSYHYRQPIRKWEAAALQGRLEKIVASSEFNARNLARLVDTLIQDRTLAQLIETDLVDGAFSIFHKLKRMPDQSLAHQHLHRLRQEGFLVFLWEHCHGLQQHRRILKLWLKSVAT